VKNDQIEEKRHEVLYEIFNLELSIEYIFLRVISLVPPCHVTVTGQIGFYFCNGPFTELSQVHSSDDFLSTLTYATGNVKFRFDISNVIPYKLKYRFQEPACIVVDSL